VGVNEVEALAHQGLLIVEHHAVEVDEGLGVDEDADVFEVEDAVALARLRVEANVVGETGAAAALNAEAQAAFSGRDALLGHGDADALEGAVGQLDSLLRGSLVVGVEYVEFCHGPVSLPGRVMRASSSPTLCRAREGWVTHSFFSKLAKRKLSDFAARSLRSG